MENINLSSYKRSKFAFSLFIILTFISILYLAYLRPLCETLEAETASIAREYLRGTPCLINYLNGAPDLDKPPLYYWTVAIFGGFISNWEVASRLPSILSALVFIGLFFFIVRKQKDKLDLFYLSSFFFLTCPKIFWMAQIARMDMFFSLTCFSAIYFFLLAYKKRLVSLNSDHVLATFFILTAISVMIKGPLGIILTFIPIIIFLFIEKKNYLIKEFFINKFLLLFFLIWIPWYIYASFKTNNAFFTHFFLQENLARFTSLIPSLSQKEFNHSPFLRYFTYYFIGFFPWSFLTPIWIYELIKRWHKDTNTIKAEEKIFLVYFIFIFLFMTLSMSKRSDYILPIYPVAAFFTAKFSLEKIYNKTFNALAKIGAFSICLSSVVILYALTKPDILIELGLVQSAEKLSFFKNIISKNSLWITLTLVLSLIILIRKKLTKETIFVIVGGILLSLSLGPLSSYYAGKDLRPFCSKLRKDIAKYQLYFLGGWDEQLAFYLDRKIIRVGLLQGINILKSDKKNSIVFTYEKKLKKIKKMGVNPHILAISNAPLIKIYALLPKKGK